MTEDSTETVNIEELQLDDVVGMEPDTLTDTHREFLDNNKGNLTADQQAKFGYGEEQSQEDSKDKDEKKPVTPEIPAEPVVKTPIKLEFDDEEDDGMDEEDRDRIRKQVAKGSKTLIERQQLIEDTQALNSIIADAPELKPYKETALKWMKAHPTLTADAAMTIASAGQQQKLGAEKERIAAERARRTQNPGSQVRSSNTGSKNWATATDAEVEAQIAMAKGQRI